MRRIITSPLCAMGAAYVYIFIVIISFYFLGYYTGNNFFNWGPPITLFGKTVETQKDFYLLHLLIFFHQILNNWVNNVVYPWMINDIQDRKNKKMIYGKRVSLLLTNLFAVYSEIDVMFIIVGFVSQISFFFTVSLANIITSTVINYRHIEEKREEEGCLLNAEEMV